MKEAIELSEAIYGWTRGEEAAELARFSAAAPANAVIVEIGSFLGSGTVLLAAPRRAAGSGVVHAVDPFDGSGDSFSVPYYAQAIERLGGETQKQYFDRAVTVSGVAAFVETHVGTAVDIAKTWSAPVDLLFLDGDQSVAGAAAAYDAWLPFLKVGGMIAVHNANPGPRGVDHDGMLRLVESEAFGNCFEDVRLVGTTVFGRRRGHDTFA